MSDFYPTEEFVDEICGIKSLWKGRLLVSFTKPELIEIIELLNKRVETLMEDKQHERHTLHGSRPTPSPRRPTDEVQSSILHRDD